MGNLGSIKNMFKHLNIPSIISSELSDIESADKLILPGVGAFDNGMKNIVEKGLTTVLNKIVIEEKIPILGICLGMQLFARKSDEGKLPGLGWIDAEINKFRFDGNNGDLKIPHMGWNLVETKKESRLFDKMYDEPRFYFVHSYHLLCMDDSNELCQTNYGYNFTSGVEKNNIYGVQFHPEKSHKFGMKLLENFAKLD
jgi:glutamine amidotransferase